MVTEGSEATSRLSESKGQTIGQHRRSSNFSFTQTFFLKVDVDFEQSQENQQIIE